MRRGRPPAGGEVVDHLEGSAQAKDRLRAILEVMQGRITVGQACARLGITESRLHALRRELLQGALQAAEPKARGRPPAQADCDPEQLAELREANRQLRVELQSARVREELALVMPEVLGSPEPPPAASGGKRSARHRRPKGRDRPKGRS